MYKLYEVVIYTASLSIYADPLLDEIDPSNYASYRLFREHCTFYNNTFVKDLSLMGRDLKDVIIVDNSPNSYMLQPENAIPILTWTEDMQDTKLSELAPVLELLVRADDVRDAIKDFVHGDVVDYIEAAEILSRKFAPKPRVDTWINGKEIVRSPRQPGKKSATTKQNGNRKETLKEPPKKQKTKSASAEHFAAMGPVTPQYKSKARIHNSVESVGLPFGSSVPAGDLVLVSAKGTIKKKHTLNVRKVGTDEAVRLGKKPLKLNINQQQEQRESPLQNKQKRPASEAAEKRKKSSTPTPYSSVSLARGSPAGKSLTNLREKTLPLHQQPRQHSTALGKRNGKNESVRAGTPRAVEGSHKSSNPAPGKAALFYSNLLRTKNEPTTKESFVVSPPSGQPKSKTKATGSSGISSHILRGLEESANKKLNKHSSSLDNTDWMACYEKLRKELNLNSPKDVPPASGRVSMNSMRPGSGVVLLGEYIPKRPLVTPVPSAANPFTARPRAAGHEPKAKRLSKSKPKPVLVTNNGKFDSMLSQMEGKRPVLDGKGVQRPVVLSHHKR